MYSKSFLSERYYFSEQNLHHATGIAFRRKLFTPGPLMVSDRVKTAMMADIGKRHADFAYIVK